MPVSVGVVVFDATVVVAEFIVPFASRVIVIKSPTFVISKSLFAPVSVRSLAYDASDAVAPASSYELSVGTMVLLMPPSFISGAIVSIMMLEPCKSVSVNVLVSLLSSLVTAILNPRLPSLNVESTV